MPMLSVCWSQVTRCNPLRKALSQRHCVSDSKTQSGSHVTLLTLIGSSARSNMGKKYQTLGMIIILLVTLSVFFLDDWLAQRLDDELKDFSSLRTWSRVHRSQ